jgi:hypothetical protein
MLTHFSCCRNDGRWNGFLVDFGLDDVTAPDGIDVPRWVCEEPQRGMVMLEIPTVGLDLAKNVFERAAGCAISRTLRGLSSK